jgi:DNA-binding SARP family transcriptional activator
MRGARMSLYLVAFGPPVLTKDGGPVAQELAWRKHFALLVYLARSPGGTRRRDHLVGLLWPDKAEAKARHSLNEACRAIRRGAGEGALTTQTDAVTLVPGTVTADWEAAEAAFAAGDGTALAQLWRGDFLEGFGIPDATPFEDWLAAERIAWRARFRDALTAEAERVAQRGDPVRALALASQVLKHDPSAEAALRIAMMSEALTGAAPAALERFAAYREWLAREHEAEPARELALLAERIRGGTRGAGRSAASREAAEPPLMGRQQALAVIARHLPRAGVRASLLIVTGEPGHGRTRLIREAEQRARLDGAIVVGTAVVAADADTPGGVLGELLRRGLADAPGLGAAPAEALGALAGLSPAVAARYPGAAPVPATTAAELGRAFGAALAAVAGETPLLVTLDDAQLADDLTLDALPVMLREAAVAPLTVVLAVRLASDLPAPLLELRSRAGNDLPGSEVAAEPLADPDVDELVAAMLPAYDAAQRDRLVRRLRREAGGVPLYIVEIVRALAAGGETAGIWPLAGETTAQPLPFKVPGAVAAALTLRAAALSPPERETLLAAAVLGIRVEEALVAGVTEVAVSDVDQHLGRLEAAGFLVHDGEQYRFGADVVRVYLASSLLSGGQRRALHERAVQALAQAGQEDGIEFAEHLYGAARWAEAGAAAVAVARAAKKRRAARLAARAEKLAARAAERAASG